MCTIMMDVQCTIKPSSIMISQQWRKSQGVRGGGEYRAFCWDTQSSVLTWECLISSRSFGCVSSMYIIHIPINAYCIDTLLKVRSTVYRLEYYLCECLYPLHTAVYVACARVWPNSISCAYLCLCVWCLRKRQQYIHRLRILSPINCL